MNKQERAEFRRVSRRLKTLRKRLLPLLTTLPVLRDKQLYHKLRLAYARSDPDASLGRTK